MAKEIQVIGCGMSRTGTVSFGLACERLFGGPVYHGGQVIVEREEAHLLKWLDIFKWIPCQNEMDRSNIQHSLHKQLEGYTATFDFPCIRLVEEQMALYPNAKVICTIRDPEDWWRSFEPVVKQAGMPFLRFALFWLPTLRYFATYVRTMQDAFYPEGPPVNGRDIYPQHMEYLRRVVPEGKLHFFNVKEGWGPLCRILDKPIPNEPFSRANDTAAVEMVFRKMILKGLLSWAVVTAVVGVVLRYLFL